MKYQILVVEDNSKSRKMLISMLNKIDIEMNILEADNIDTAYRYAVECTIHLFLLDIVLDSTDRGSTAGITFASHIRKLPKYRKTPIIFISSLEDHKLFAYSELHCYQYIEKPFNQETALTKIQEALDLIEPDEKVQFITFKKDGILYSVRKDKIQYINADKPITQIYLTDDFLEISYIPITKLLYLLNSSEFVQCNRNMIINRNYIENMDTVNNFLKIKKVEELIPLGNAYKKLLREH